MEVRAEKIKKEFIRKSGGTNVFTAVAETDFVLSTGKLTVVCGRSGGGKSTFLNMLAGILQPTGGRVFYDDTDIFSLSDDELSAFRNRQIGYIPQGTSAISSLNVRENILLPFMLSDGDFRMTLRTETSAKTRDVGKDKADTKSQTDVVRENRDELSPEKRAAALMEQFGISHLADAMPGELSGGELRRMAIARALIRMPAVLFADEPTGDLDDENTEIVFQALREAAERGAAVLCVTHENDAKDFADVWYRMDAGRLA